MKKILISISIISLFIIACGDLTELNENTKSPDEVPAGALFANATVALFDFMASTNVNVNNLKLWAQHWTETTYQDEANYELTERNVNGRTFDILYATVIRDLRAAKVAMQDNEFLSQENKQNQEAIFTVMEVYSYHLLVDIFGDVPYSAAYGDDVTPEYDRAQDIYDAIINDLDNAIDNLGGESALGGDDLIYGGNTAAWKKAANSLKLRLAVRIADFNEGRAQTMAEEAVSSGVFGSSSDNLTLQYTTTTPHTNPLWVDLVQSGRNDFVAGNTMVDHMNDLDDPRRFHYFIPPYDSTGNPIGGIVGANNTYSEYSHITERVQAQDYPHTILSYNEVLFLLADAAERGFDVGGDAEQFYNMAVTHSILEWDGTQEEADDYLAQSDVDYTTGDWRERIGMQKWIAMYNRGFEAWSSYRLYDAPELNEAAEAGTTPPLRYIYPVDEYSLNGESVNAAAANYDGDDSFAPIFWDVN